MMDPADALLALIDAGWTTQVVRAACLLGLPERLAAGEPTPEELAAATGCHAPSLHRLLRAMAVLELCREAGAGRYTATAIGQRLCADHPQTLRDWALLVGGPHWLRWAELDRSVATGLSHKQRHTGEQGFGDLDADPAAGAVFHRAMRQLTRRVAGGIVDALALQGSACVVDVGGGSGELIAQLLQAHPAARGVLFDLATGLADARRTLEAAGVAGRCDLVAGSFVDRVPPGGDVYLLKSVLHNWDDERCVRILAHCRAGLRPGGRVVAVERLMPDRPGPDAADRAVVKSDLNMLVALTGRERGSAEFAALFAAAGLAASRVVPAGKGFWLVEAVLG